MGPLVPRFAHPVHGVDVSPNGAHVAAIDRRGHVRVWRIPSEASGKHVEVAAFRAETTAYALAWLDDAHIVVQGTKGVVRWAATGAQGPTLLKTTRKHEPAPFSLSRDRRRLAVRMRGVDACVRVHDVATLPADHAAGVRLDASGDVLLLTHDGASVIVAGGVSMRGRPSTQLRILAVASPDVARDVYVEGVQTGAASLSADDAIVALGDRTADGSHRVALVRLADGAVLRVLEEDVRPPKPVFGDRAHCVRFSRDGARLLSSAPDGEGRVWDVVTGALLARWPDAVDGAWSPRGDALYAFGSGENVVLRHDVDGAIERTSKRRQADHE